MRLSELETDAQLDVPREMGRAVKALASDQRHAAAWRFIVEELCGHRRLSFVPGRSDPTELMIWREGRRFVGEWLMRIAEAPMDDETPPEPAARTMTERALRRAKKPTT